MMQISCSISELQTHPWSRLSKAPPLLSSQASHGRMLQVNLTFQSCNPTEMYPLKFKILYQQGKQNSTAASGHVCNSHSAKVSKLPSDKCFWVSLKAYCLPVVLFRYCRMLFFGIFLSSGSGEFSNPTQIHTGWGLYKYSFSASTWQEAKKWPVWLFEPKKKTLAMNPAVQWKVKVNSEYIRDLSDWSLAIMGVQTSKEILSEFVVIKKNIGKCAGPIWAHRWFCITVWSSIY